MTMLPYIVFGFTYAFAAAVQPGPLQTYFIAQSVQNGWRRTLPAAFAPLLSDGPIIAVTLLLLSQVPDAMVAVLHLVGGFFLLGLAALTLRTWRRFDPEQPPKTRSAGRSLIGAVLVNLLNPNPYLGWSLVMGPLFLKGWHETPANGLALLVAFYATMTGVTMATIVLFGVAAKLGPRINKAALAVSAVALAGFGIYQLVLGLTNP